MSGHGTDGQDPGLTRPEAGAKVPEREGPRLPPAVDLSWSSDTPSYPAPASLANVGPKGPGGPSKRTIAIAAGVVGALLVGGLIWLIAGSGDDDGPVATSSTTSTTTALVDIERVDFQNFDYRLSCDALGTYDISTVDGVWRGTSNVEQDVALDTLEGIEVVYVDEAVGAGRAAIVRVPCGFGANTVVSNVYVFRPSRDGDRGVAQVGDTVFGFHPTAGSEPGQFVIWNEAPADDDAGCCPSAYERTTYAIAGDHLERVQTEVVPAAETPFAMDEPAKGGSGGGTTGGTTGGTGGPTLDEQLLRLRNPSVGDQATYIRGAFTLPSDAPVRDGIGADAAIVRHGGFLRNPELVQVGGIDYAVATESSDDPGTSARQLRVVRVSDLGGDTSDVRVAPITQLDQAGDAYVAGASPDSTVRQYVNESGDVVVPKQQIPENRD